MREERDDRDVLALGEAGGTCSEPEGAVLSVFNLLGKRWSGPLIAALMTGPGHFAELKRAVPGISERMLSDRLSELTAAGLVTRRVQEGPPLRVSYELTEAGRELRPAMVELTRWAVAHLEDGERCPREFRS
ncbi:winged helix-turn-helix transcriptional regulator [Streptomyces hoynatensis]|uniref:Transcriptional regulator n=1 Tax=Streptomyces hoynatensis TaxID=1141874 RepID=A0A3A9Z5R3_9ACTN|nr:helix-turn-helix domain-containing protein [Streptomyces hoynatensis]RKN43174.1 transcriptional regulator [Streptomyces hoynatensis]